MNANFCCLVFDLDDTLVDTWNLLFPRAQKHMCEALVKNGLKASLSQCEQALKQMPVNINSVNLLVEKFGSSQATPEQLIELGRTAYRCYPIPEPLPLFPGARELMGDLHQRYRMHLLTAGHPE